MRRFFALPPGIWLGLLSLLVWMIFRLSPFLAEYLYSRGVYPVLRILLDNSIGRLPFPMIYLLVLVLLLLLVRRVLRRLRERPQRSWKEKLKVAALNLGNFAGWVAFLFFISWGYNYSRIPVEEYLDLQTRPLNAEEIQSEITWVHRQAELARSQIPAADSFALKDELYTLDREEAMREGLAATLQDLGYSAPGRVRTKNLFPSELLDKLGILGIYFPFAGESYVAGNLPMVKKLATTAHEMAHGYGFGDEGTCNFWAFLTCIRSKNAMTRYSGYLDYWRYLAREWYKLDPESYSEHRKSLSPGMQNDLRMITEYYRKHSSWLSGLSSKVNNVYLKIQGVKEGVQSYARVVVLIHAFRKKYPDWIPQG